MSLVNVSLNLQKSISQICHIFVENNVRTKNSSALGDKAVKHLTSELLNELVKLNDASNNRALEANFPITGSPI